MPRVIITDKLSSYSAAKAEVMPGVGHRRHKGLSNRAENSHQPTGIRERGMRRFKSPGQAQRFLSAFEMISSRFRPKCHLLTVKGNRDEMKLRFTTWQEVICTETAAGMNRAVVHLLSDLSSLAVELTMPVYLGIQGKRCVYGRTGFRRFEDDSTSTGQR